MNTRFASMTRAAARGFVAVKNRYPVSVLRYALIGLDVLALVVAVELSLFLSGMQYELRFWGMPVLVMTVVGGLLLLEWQHLYRARVATVRSVELGGLLRTALALGVVNALAFRGPTFDDAATFGAILAVLAFVLLAFGRSHYQSWLTRARAAGPIPPLGGSGGRQFRRARNRATDRGSPRAWLLARRGGRYVLGGSQLGEWMRLDERHVRRRPLRTIRRRQRSRRGCHRDGDRRRKQVGPRPARCRCARSLLARSQWHQRAARPFTAARARADVLPGTPGTLGDAEELEAGSRRRRRGRRCCSSRLRCWRSRPLRS